MSGEVLCRLEGHLEEILCVKRVWYRGELYLLSGGQDGRVYKWPMNADCSALRRGMLFVVFLFYF